MLLLSIQSKRTRQIINSANDWQVTIYRLIQGIPAAAEYKPFKQNMFEITQMNLLECDVIATWVIVSFVVFLGLPSE